MFKQIIIGICFTIFGSFLQAMEDIDYDAPNAMPLVAPPPYISEPLTLVAPPRLPIMPLVDPVAPPSAREILGSSLSAYLRNDNAMAKSGFLYLMNDPHVPYDIKRRATHGFISMVTERDEQARFDLSQEFIDLQKKFAQAQTSQEIYSIISQAKRLHQKAKSSLHTRVAQGTKALMCRAQKAALEIIVFEEEVE